MAVLSADQLACIESIGLNCEVGNVLRRFGNETPSLFRWTWAPPSAILDLLRSDFTDLYAPDNMAPGHHNEVFDRRYKIWFHTNLRTGDPDGGHDFRFLDPDEKARLRILKAERSVVMALVDRFRQRMRTPDVLYVLTRHAREPDGPAGEIAAAIKAHAGDAAFNLLEVREAPDASHASRVERVGETLLQGWVARFAPYDAAHDIDLASWTPLLQAALAMTKARPWWRPRRAASHAVG